MPGLTTLLSVLALAPSGFYVGSTPVAPQVSLTISGGRVVQASAWSKVYTCQTGGNLGAAEVRVAPQVKVAGNGAINFDSGRPSRKMKARLRLRRGAISGSVQLVGKIAGSGCGSPMIRVTLRRR